MADLIPCTLGCIRSAVSSLPALPVSYITAAGIVGLTILLYSLRTVIGGSFRPRLKVPPPPEASLDYEPPKTAKPVPAELKDPQRPGMIRTYDKCTLLPLGDGYVKAFTKEDVVAAVQKARRAQAAWSKTPLEQRAYMLQLVQDYITEHQQEICVVAARDTGKTLVDGGFGEVLTTCEKIVWTINEGPKALKTEWRTTGAVMLHKTARVEYTPLGVLGAIIPWNYPFHNMFGQLISALFAGNAIVIKVSEYASWSATYYLQIIHAALAAVGQSPDLVQIVTGFGDAGAALVNSGVDKLTFIGSPQVGKLVMRAAADTLTPVVLELGGKDAAIICEDCDFNQVCNLALRGTFQNCGQNCIGLERMVVLAPIYDKIVRRMEEKVKNLKQGNPLGGDVDCGAMTMGTASAKKVEAMVQDAVKSGARLLAGGSVNSSPGCAGGFMQPTLLVDVTPEMKIAQEEVFGPVMVIMKAKDDNDAIRIANAGEYGLGSSVFSKDYARAERIAARLVTGMCNVNDYGVNYLCQSLPFGGVKISGFDRFAGIEGLRGCCLMRSVTSDKFPGVRTDIPPPLQYPVGPSGFKFVQALINMFYGSTLAARAKGLVNLAVIGLTEKAKP